MSILGPQVDRGNHVAEGAEGVGFGEGLSPNRGGIWEGGCPPREKNEFLYQNGEFSCILEFLGSD